MSNSPSTAAQRRLIVAIRMTNLVLLNNWLSMKFLDPLIIIKTIKRPLIISHGQAVDIKYSDICFLIFLNENILTLN